MNDRCVVRGCEKEETKVIFDRTGVYSMGACDEHINAVGTLLGNDLNNEV